MLHILQLGYEIHLNENLSHIFYLVHVAINIELSRSE